MAHASIVGRAAGDRAASSATDHGLHSEVVCKWWGVGATIVTMIALPSIAPTERAERQPRVVAGAEALRGSYDPARTPGRWSWRRASPCPATALAAGQQRWLPASSLGWGCTSGRSTRYHPAMEKFATPDEVVAQIRRMSIEDREYVEAELMRDAYEAGRLTEPPSVMDEIIRRANEALASPDTGLSREEAIASARAAAQEVRRRRS